MKVLWQYAFDYEFLNDDMFTYTHVLEIQGIHERRIDSVAVGYIKELGDLRSREERFEYPVGVLIA